MLTLKASVFGLHVIAGRTVYIFMGFAHHASKLCAYNSGAEV
ncbi:hypothetical protein PALI_a2666 [Pseudoalteromonas aliena SW19]|uniref:Transposase n=1 Tax=Pseudoalteromonas aliena SW19 TaxID=1314866 RepID=A0ABR9E216_9GAMM|nr:hypothetical protein [Pseudoalteromonas aliena SW19]